MDLMKEIAQQVVLRPSDPIGKRVKEPEYQVLNSEEIRESLADDILRLRK